MQMSLGTVCFSLLAALVLSRAAEVPPSNAKASGLRIHRHPPKAHKVGHAKASAQDFGRMLVDVEHHWLSDAWKEARATAAHAVTRKSSTSLAAPAPSPAVPGAPGPAAPADVEEEEKAPPFFS